MDDLKRKEDDIKLKELIAAYRNGNQNALEEILVICEGMVIHMSKKYYSIAEQRNMPIEDLKQEAYVGLLGAVNNFKIKEDNSFISYVLSAMNHSILVYIRNNSNWVVKTNIDKGMANLTSMDKTLNDSTDTTFGETLFDEEQEEQFLEIEKLIDEGFLKKDIQNMLNTIIGQDSDIAILKDVYGLNGTTYSFDEICKRNNLTLRELIFKERLMIIQIQNSPKLERYIEKFDYHCKEAYKYGVQRFKDTRVSSTEFVALRHLELIERGEQVEQEH